MKKTSIPNYLTLIGCYLLFSCTSVEETSPADSNSKYNFEIESSYNLEIISHHENGWIKEGIKKDEGLRSEFEYFENGNLKSTKLFDTYPEDYMCMEVMRNSNNETLWSKYYHPDGSIWFETQYDNGLHDKKIIYNESNITTHFYSDGAITSSEVRSTNGDLISKTDYNQEVGTRVVTVMKDDNIIYQETLSFEEAFGNGIHQNSYTLVGNPFDNPDIQNPTPLLTSSGSSIAWWSYPSHPRFLVTPNRFYSYYSHPEHLNYAITDDIYQSVLEQYPFLETDEVLHTESRRIQEQQYFRDLSDGHESIHESYNSNKELFTLKYGDSYIFKKTFGRYQFTLGVIRNLPTESDTAEKIKEIAEKKMEYLLNGTAELNEEETELLEKVWFEIRHFSPSLHRSTGIIIESFEQYNNILNQYMDGEDYILQKEYRSFESVFRSREENNYESEPFRFNLK